MDKPVCILHGIRSEDLSTNREHAQKIVKAGLRAYGAMNIDQQQFTL
jgi:hypothetical protein